MKQLAKLMIVFLFLVMPAEVTNVFAETSLSQQLAHCAAIGNSQERLACYDELAQQNSANAGQSAGPKFIQPPATFLDSHLVSHRWKAEYTLTVRSFVDLISHTVMENGKHITVQGWSRDKNDYVLHITMRKPVKLHFLPGPSTKGDKSMSLLRDVKMDGYISGADQFIMTIAAMDTDKKADNKNTH
ncbi:MAG: hypothetical protein P8Z72_15275 [Gammaproteobacteria bacterium]|jgi:hypothetical protein